MTETTHSRFRASPRIQILVASALVIMMAVAVPAAERSSLDRPDRVSTPLLTVGPTVGGAPDWQPFRYGASASILFRPDAAAELISAFYDWDTALVLQWEYREIDLGRSLNAADAVLRHYLGEGSGSALFAGIGAGVALIKYPPTTAAAADEESEEEAATTVTDSGEDKYYSLVLEFGYERDLTPSVAMLWKAQWRNYVWSGHDFSNYTVHVQIGFPLPW